MLFYPFPVDFGGLHIDFSRLIFLLLNDGIFGLQLSLLFQHILLHVDRFDLLLLLFLVDLASVHPCTVHEVLHLVALFILVSQAFLAFQLGHGLDKPMFTLASWL